MTKYRGRCPACKAEAPDSLLCSTCTAKLSEDLGLLPGLVRDLWIAYRKGQTFEVDNDEQTSDESTLPFTASQRRAAEAITNMVGTWVRVLGEEHGDLYEFDEWVCYCTPPRQPCILEARYRMTAGRTIGSWCAWLAARIERIRAHPAVVQIDDDIRAGRERALKLVDLPPDLVFVALCSVCNRGIYAKPGEESALCQRCKRAGIPTQSFSVTEAKAEQLRMLEHQWVTVAKCAMLLASYGLPVKADTIHNWTREERGARLQPRGVNREGQKLYRLGDVAELVREAKQRKDERTRA